MKLGAPCLEHIGRQGALVVAPAVLVRLKVVWKPGVREKVLDDLLEAAIIRLAVSALRTSTYRSMRRVPVCDPPLFVAGHLVLRGAEVVLVHDVDRGDRRCGGRRGVCGWLQEGEQILDDGRLARARRAAAVSAACGVHAPNADDQHAVVCGHGRWGLRLHARSPDIALRRGSLLRLLLLALGFLVVVVLGKVAVLVAGLFRGAAVVLGRLVLEVLVF